MELIVPPNHNHQELGIQSVVSDHSGNTFVVIGVGTWLNRFSRMYFGHYEAADPFHYVPTAYSTLVDRFHGCTHHRLMPTNFYDGSSPRTRSRDDQDAVFVQCIRDGESEASYGWQPLQQQATTIQKFRNVTNLELGWGRAWATAQLTLEDDLETLQVQFSY